MQEVGWLRSRIEINEELLWRARQRSRELLDHRASIASLWDDSAARQVRERYLTPHEQDDARLVDRLTGHADALTQTLGAIERTPIAAAAADREAAEISVRLYEAAAVLERATANVSAAGDAASRAAGAAAHAESLIQQAESHAI
jgi:hypothetical protein